MAATNAVVFSLAMAPPLKVYDLGQVSHIADPEEEEEDYGTSMGQVKHKFHRSEKILGRLYRDIDERQIWTRNICRSMNGDGPSVWKQVLDIVKARLSCFEQRFDYRGKIGQAWKFRNL